MPPTANHQPPATTANYGPPAWFRLATIALATLILCSCQAATQQTSQQTGLSSVQNDAHIQPAAYAEPADCMPQACIPAPCIPESASCIPQSAIRNPYSPDEYLCDGGDGGSPAGVRRDWAIEGLEQQDTVAHYDTVDGRTVITPSNRVCIYAPRFGVVRQVTDLHEYARFDMAGGMDQRLVPVRIDEKAKTATSLAQLEPSIHRARNASSLLRERQQAGGLARERRVAESIGSLAPYADLQLVRTGMVSNNEMVRVARSSLAAVTWAGDQGPQVLLDSKQAQAAVSDQHLGMIFQMDEPNEPKLRLVKLASTNSAQPGEEVEFTLRYDNIGNREIGNVTLVDNLTTRLEYVEGSAKSSLTADFSTAPNDSGSQLLRWEIRDPIQPGEGGILQFKCRVR